MFAKTREFLKKLEFGALEISLEILMFVSVIGYFISVPADLDWLDHIASFIAFALIFYHVGITSLLFGNGSKSIDKYIIFSFFMLFFKDIVIATKQVAHHFAVLKFIDYFYIFYNNHPAIINFLPFYLGILGLICISYYITRNIEIKPPSFLQALKPTPFKRTAWKFTAVFMVLLWFYYFLFNLILEWLEYALDDPIVFVGILLFVHRLTKHKHKFENREFMHKVGEFSEGLYKRFISLFHSRKTIPIAISGLLILHALSDLSVFFFSLTTGKANVFIEELGEHHSFYDIFMEDSSAASHLTKLFLIISYLLNVVSFIVLLVIPVAAWFKIFYQKELHFSRIYLPLIYSSMIAYFLLPGYSINQIEKEGIVGVDVVAKSLLETKSLIGFVVHDRPLAVALVAILSLAAGVLVYMLSARESIKKELFAVSIIVGLFYYTGYTYIYTLSLLKYFYLSIIMLISTPNFFISLILFIFLILSVIFYIGGYLMLIYEIIMEYHNRKWSDPIDEELVKVISKLKSIHIGGKKKEIPANNQINDAISIAGKNEAIDDSGNIPLKKKNVKIKRKKINTGKKGR